MPWLWARGEVFDPLENAELEEDTGPLVVVGNFGTSCILHELVAVPLPRVLVPQSEWGRIVLVMLQDDLTVGVVRPQRVQERIGVGLLHVELLLPPMARVAHAP